MALRLDVTGSKMSAPADSYGRLIIRLCSQHRRRWLANTRRFKRVWGKRRGISGNLSKILSNTNKSPDRNGFYDREKIAGLEARAPYECAVHIRDSEDFGGIVRFDGAAIEKANLVAFARET